MRWGELLARGDALHRPGDPPPNRALAFATAAADGAAADRRDYEWAGAVVDALAQKGGPGYFARLETLLEAEPAGNVAGATGAAARASDPACRGRRRAAALSSMWGAGRLMGRAGIPAARGTLGLETRPDSPEAAQVDRKTSHRQAGSSRAAAVLAAGEDERAERYA